MSNTGDIFIIMLGLWIITASFIFKHDPVRGFQRAAAYNSDSLVRLCNLEPTNWVKPGHNEDYIEEIAARLTAIQCTDPKVEIKNYWDLAHGPVYNVVLICQGYEPQQFAMNQHYLCPRSK